MLFLLPFLPHFQALCVRYLSFRVNPYLDNEVRGIFSTRAPSRPNSIGVSVVRLVKIEETMLQIQDVDIVDGAPLLDIKPYVPAFDTRKTVKIGWLEKNIHVKR